MQIKDIKDFIDNLRKNLPKIRIDFLKSERERFQIQEQFSINPKIRFSPLKEGKRKGGLSSKSNLSKSGTDKENRKGISL